MITRGKNTTSRLRERVTLQEEVRTADNAGGFARTWQNVADLWAEITATSSRERLAGMQLQSEVTYRLVIRYRPNITANMRFLYESRVLNIRSIVNVQESNELLEIVVVEGDAA